LKPISSGVESYSSADLLGGAAAFGVVDREYQLVGAYVELDRAAPLAGDGGYAVDRAHELGVGHLQLLVVGLRDHPPVIGEGAVDQLGGERDGADLEAGLCRRYADADGVAAVLDETMQLVHGLARQDDARHATGALGCGQLRLSQAMAVSCHRAQGLLLAALRGVQIDAVEVVAGLFGGDGEPRLVDQPLEVLGGKRERMAELPAARSGKSSGAASAAESGMAGPQRQALLLGVALRFHLRAVRQLAHDIVQHVRRHGDGARLGTSAGARPIPRARGRWP
jgi:hypothetical protein